VLEENRDNDEDQKVRDVEQALQELKDEFEKLMEKDNGKDNNA
jgi:hypothetical protein